MYLLEQYLFPLSTSYYSINIFDVVAMEKVIELF